jgi:hypothetical protein
MSSSFQRPFILSKQDYYVVREKLNQEQQPITTKNMTSKKNRDATLFIFNWRRRDKEDIYI